MTRAARFLLGLLPLLALLGWWVWPVDPSDWPVRERVELSQGRYALVHVGPMPLFASFLPTMPGNGSQRSGAVAIHDEDGTLCGTARVAQAGLVDIKDWEHGIGVATSSGGWATIRCDP